MNFASQKEEKQMTKEKCRERLDGGGWEEDENTCKLCNIFLAHLSCKQHVSKNYFSSSVPSINAASVLQAASISIIPCSMFIDSAIFAHLPPAQGLALAAWKFLAGFHGGEEVWRRDALRTRTITRVKIPSKMQLSGLIFHLTPDDV